MARVLIPLPARDFDPTEAAVAWKVCSARGHRIVFATPEGAPAAADDMMLTGCGLDAWGFVPGLDRLRLVGVLMRADSRGRAAYAAMTRDPAYNQPWRWRQVSEKDFDGLVLPGGHRARGMREYLESPLLEDLAVAFFRADKAVGAICHGVLLLARSIDPLTGRSVLSGRKTTALTWSMERLAGRVGRIVRWWDPNYYRTYPDHSGSPKGSYLAALSASLPQQELVVALPSVRAITGANSYDSDEIEVNTCSGLAHRHVSIASQLILNGRNDEAHNYSYRRHVGSRKVR